MDIDFLKEFKVGTTAIIRSKVLNEHLAVEVHMEFDEELGRMEVLSPFDNALFMITPDDKFWMILSEEDDQKISEMVESATEKVGMWMGEDEETINDFFAMSAKEQRQEVDDNIDEFFDKYYELIEWAEFISARRDQIVWHVQQFLGKPGE